MKAPPKGEKRVWPPLFLLQATWYLAAAPKSRELADADCTLILRRQRGERLAVPDAALDQHTSRGRAMGRGIAHFLGRGRESGRWIENHVPIEGDRWQEAFYAEWTPGDPRKRVLE